MTKRIYEVYEKDNLIFRGHVEGVLELLCICEETMRKYRDKKPYKEKYRIVTAGFEPKKRWHFTDETEDNHLWNLKYNGNTVTPSLSKLGEWQEALNKKIIVDKRKNIIDGKMEGYYYYLEVAN